MIFIWNIDLKYYICHKLNNLISETYDKNKVEYEVGNGDAVEDKETIIGSEKSSQVVGEIDSGK